jgi:uncharacterized membrane protein
MTQHDTGFLVALGVAGGLIWYMWSIKRAERRTGRVERPGCMAWLILLVAIYLAAESLDLMTDGGVMDALVRVEHRIERAQQTVKEVGR